MVLFLGKKNYRHILGMDSSTRRFDFTFMNRTVTVNLLKTPDIDIVL